MAAEGTSQTSCFTQNPSLITTNSMFGFSPNDSLGLQLLPHRLNGNLFLQWSQDFRSMIYMAVFTIEGPAEPK